MYPSSSSSSSQKSMGSAAGGGGAGTGLTRYGSAPGSFLSTAVESVIGRAASARSSMAGHYFTGDSSESTGKGVNGKNPNEDKPGSGSGSGFKGSYGFGNGDGGDLKLGGVPSSSSSLVRQRSSPAGFFSHLSPESTGGFSVTRGPGVSRLKPQLSFTRQESLAQISELGESVLDGVGPENGHQKASHSYASGGFGIDSWDNTNSIVFSAPPSKRAKNMDGDFLNYTSLESQFSLPQTSLEMATMEKLMQIPEDSVPCKIRAKRGCATHPRSIAERERRTRISGKLKKLQDLVPNMDKQTSYSDMLDLAVQHIRGLQNQVQNLHKDLENCRCGCKPSTQ